MLEIKRTAYVCTFFAGIFRVWETEGFVGNKLCFLGGRGAVECTFYHT